MNISFLNLINIVLFSFLIFLLGALFVSSFWERRLRPRYISFVLIVTLLVMFLLFYRFNNIGVVYVLNLVFITLFSIPILMSIVYWFPSKKDPIDREKITQFDERDHMLSRNMIKDYPHLYKKYYTMYPDRKQRDKIAHKLPELGQPGSKFYDPIYSLIPDAAFTVIAKTAPSILEGKPWKDEKESIDPGEITEIIKNIAMLYGAIDVGITELRSYHLYSYRGRQPDTWGDRVDLLDRHKYAIAIFVKKSLDMINEAPSLPIVFKSSRQYLEAAKIAYVISEFIRGLGYDALPHVDANYQLSCVAVAWDTGLGDVGRFGYFIHGKYGPGVRIAVVTTDLILSPTKKRDYHIDEFCSICTKCADSCPLQAINHGEKTLSRGVKRWTSDQEKCFIAWKTYGTDCGICMRECPYTKPYNLIHNLYRFYISRNPITQRIGLYLDYLFYGKKNRGRAKNPELLKFLRYVNKKLLRLKVKV